jgi:hypothetical protein
LHDGFGKSSKLNYKYSALIYVVGEQKKKRERDRETLDRFLIEFINK